jgi:transposase, IS5 family
VRSTILKQHDILEPIVDYALPADLAEIDAVLRAHPEWVRWAHADVTKKRGIDASKGRDGLPANLVLRVVLLKHKLNISLRKLTPLLADSLSLREFIGLRLSDRAPSRTTLQENVVLITPETWGKILKGLAQSAEAKEHESGEKVRIDATVTETNVHAPSDSSLLWDSIRVLTRLMTRALVTFGIEFVDESKAARKLRHRIFYAHAQAQRVPAYRDLLAVAERVNEQATSSISRLERLKVRTATAEKARVGLLNELGHYRGLFLRVINQTTRRVINGEKVRASEKVLSIFEPETDMIVKRRNQPPEYGHKITLTAGPSGMVLDCVIERGNPGDVTVAVRQVERQKKLLGRAPRTAVFDGAYSSKENLERANELGVEQCAFSKAPGLTPEEMAGSRRTYGRLRRFRAGIEATVSFLKNSFGLDRCTWKGWERFQSYVWSAILAANLTILAKRRLCPS